MRRPPSYSPLALAPLLLVACGHPATQQECEEIFRRSAEIELRSENITDPAEVERLVGDLRVARGDDLVKQCVGKRITDDALACIRTAKDAETFDGCLK